MTRVARKQKVDTSEFAVCREPIFIGLDIMLRNTCVIGIDKDGKKVIDALWSTDLKKIPRQNFYFEKFLELISQYENAYYGFEDYAYAKSIKNSRSTFSIGEVTGMFKLHIYRARLPGYIFGIGQIKKFFTGSGNAGKDVMIEQLEKTVDWVPDVGEHRTKKRRDNLSHQADAYAIALMVRGCVTGITNGLNVQQVGWLESHVSRGFEI